jgi:transcriptional regulator with XRE-family HTH domain
LSSAVGTVRGVDDDEISRERDTDSGVDRGPGALAPFSTPIVVSAHGPLHPDPLLAARGLPDFAALLAAELATVAASPTGQSSSSLGVGELVLSARELTGLSQRAVAARAGTSQNAVTAIETGNRLPTIRSLMRLVEAAGLELVVGLRRPGAKHPVALGALVSNADDGLADFLPMKPPSLFEGPSGR